MKVKWKYSIPVALIILIGIAIIYRLFTSAKGSVGGRQNAPLVKVEKPKRELVKIQLQFNGDVLPIRQAGIFSKVSGNLERIYTDMGSSVRANQLLAIIDSTELYLQSQQMFATYQNAQLTYDRIQQLVEKRLSSQQDINNAEAAMKVAKANYDASATRLSYTRILAPFAGTITKRFLDPGALVTANNATLFTLMDLDSVKIIVSIPEKDVPLITNVNIALVKFDALPGKEYTARVTRSSDAIDLATRTMDVQLEIANHDRVVKPGMFASVQMTIAEHSNAITIPTNAILKDNDGQYVFVADNHKAKRIQIKTGVELIDRIEIISGLTGEESLITVGQQFAKDGAQVTVQQ